MRWHRLRPLRAPHGATSALRRERLAASRILAVLAGSACAAAADLGDPAAPPPPLAISFADAEDLGFRRGVISSARSEALRAQGRPDLFELRGDVQYLVGVGDDGSSGYPTLELRVEECAFEGRGLGRDAAFDTRRPETLRSLAGIRGGPELLQAVQAARTVAQRYRLDSEGVPRASDEGPADAAVGAAPAPRVAPVGLRVGWFPGMLPFGEMQGRAEVGATWRFDGVLRAGDAGLRYDDPLVVSGTWRVAEWDAESGTARLALDGGAEFDDSRLRQVRVESCEMRGEATWSAALRLVTRSRVTATVVLRVRDGRAARIDWTLTLDETLIE